MRDGYKTGNSTALKKPHQAVAMLEQFPFFPGGNDFQRIAFRMTENKSSTGREQLRQMGVVEELLRK